MFIDRAHKDYKFPLHISLRDKGAGKCAGLKCKKEARYYIQNILMCEQHGAEYVLHHITDVNELTKGQTVKWLRRVLGIEETNLG